MTRTDHELLAALLGPRAPEITCEQCFAELDRYVDVEVTWGRPAADATVPGMRAHLEGCPACHEDHVSLRSFVTRG